MLIKVLTYIFFIETVLFNSTVHDAVSKGFLPRVKFFIEKKGWSVDSKNKDFDTPLHIVARTGDVKIAKYLLEHRSDINAVDKRKETPLHLAIHYNNKRMIKFFLKHGAYVDKKNYIGESPLLMTIRENKFNVFMLLFQNGKRVLSEKNKEIRRLFEVASDFNRVDVIKFLIKNGLDVNKKNKNGISPFRYAVENIFSEDVTITHLIFNGAYTNNINYSNIKKWNRIIYLRLVDDFDKSKNILRYVIEFIKKEEESVKLILKEQKEKNFYLNFAIKWSKDKMRLIERLLFCRSLQAFLNGCYAIEKNAYYKFCHYKKRICVKNLRKFIKHLKRKIKQYDLVFAQEDKACIVLQDYHFRRKLFENTILKKGPVSPDLKVVFK